MLIYGCMLIEDLILEYYTGYEILKYYLLCNTWSLLKIRVCWTLCLSYVTKEIDLI